MLTAPTFEMDPVPTDPTRRPGARWPGGLPPFGWRAMRSSRWAAAGLGAQVWAVWGDPGIVVVGVDAHQVLVAPAGPDPSRFDPTLTPEAIARVPVTGDPPTDTRALTNAFWAAVEAERGARAWCPQCGVFRARPGAAACTDCSDALTGTLR